MFSRLGTHTEGVSSDVYSRRARPHYVNLANKTLSMQPVSHANGTFRSSTSNNYYWKGCVHGDKHSDLWEVEVGGRSGPKRAVKVIPRSSKDRRIDISDNEIRICKIIRGEIERLRGHSGEERSMNLLLFKGEIMDSRKYYCKEYHFLEFEFPKGGDLDSQLRGLRYSEKDVAVIIRECLKGINFLHHLNIVHLDLRPNNIMFMDNDHFGGVWVVIGDFSGAINIGGRLSHDMLDTIARKADDSPYAAPELKNGYQKSANLPHIIKQKRTEAYSLGMIGAQFLLGSTSSSRLTSHNRTRDSDYRHSEHQNSGYRHSDYEDNPDFTRFPNWKKITEEGQQVLMRLTQNDHRRRAKVDSALREEWFMLIDNPRREPLFRYPLNERPPRLPPRHRPDTRIAPESRRGHRDTYINHTRI